MDLLQPHTNRPAIQRVMFLVFVHSDRCVKAFGCIAKGLDAAIECRPK